MSLAAALRPMLRAPGFALAVLLLVAIVAALNAITFSALWALDWKALPYRDADRLVELRLDLRDIDLQVALSESLYRRVRAETDVFAGAVGVLDVGAPLHDEADRAWRVPRISADFAQQLGVAAAAGQDFAIDDGVAGADPVLILSDRVWRARFNADPSVLGRRIRLQRREYRVVGIMPAGFAFPDAEADAWTPYVATPLERELDANGAFGQFTVAARLAPGATREQAQERLAAIIANADSLARLRASPARVQADVRPWRERFSAAPRRAVLLLQFAALLLLLVMVANVANLCLDRQLARRREFAIRRSVGARQRDLVMATLLDLLPPLLAGGLLAGLLVPAGIALLRLRGLIPANLPMTVGGDAATWLAILVVCAIVAAAASLVAIGSGLRDSAVLRTQGSAAGLGRGRTALLIGQIALSTALVGAAGLLLQSAFNVINEDRGFDPRGVLMTSVDASESQATASPVAGGAPVGQTAWMASLLSGIADLPGVRHVAYADSMPFSDSHFIARVQLPGVIDSVEVRSYAVSPDYFAAMEIPLLRGTPLAPGAAGGEVPIVVDETFSRRWLGSADPIGMPVRMEAGEEGEFGNARIVGVVPSVKHRALDENREHASIYQLTAPAPAFFLITRSEGDPALLADAVRDRVRRLAPDAVLNFNLPLADAMAKTLRSRRALLEAIGAFALITLGLAALGLYAVLSVVLRRRTAELGVRMALGASSTRVFELLLRQGAVLAAIGVALGLGASVALAPLLSDRLYRLSAFDPTTWGLAGALVMMVSLFACARPARRAARTNPVVALRHE